MAKEEEKPKQTKQPPAQTPPQPPPGPPPKRPMLASILSIIIMIVGLLTIISGVLVMMGGGLLASLPGVSTPAGFAVAFGAIILLMGLVFLMTGVGLWKLKKWALYLVALPMVLYLGILGGSAAINQGDFGLALVCAPVPIIAIVLLLYLVSIRKRFR